MTARILLAPLLLALSAPAIAQDQPTAGPPWSAEVAVPSSRLIAFTSAINGHEYALSIRVPLTPPPPGGHPVIYVLDGDFLFGTASDLSLTIADPRRAPVVVAIGHGLLNDPAVAARHSGRPADTSGPITLSDIGRAMNVLRFHELTLPVAPEHRAPEWTGLTPANVGGLDTFLQVIEQEIKPRVAATVPIDAADQALFGHSIAGLAVLRALFTQPAAFRTFIAASPSIWWDADAVLREEPAFSAAVASGQVAPRVLITVGGEEPDSPNPPDSFIATLPPEQAASLRAYVEMASQCSGMVSGSRTLAQRLGRVDARADFAVEFVSFPGESHASVLPAALSRGMRFAFDSRAGE